MTRLALVVAAVLASACALASPRLTPDRISTEIRSEGAGPVVRRLWASGDYERVLDRIASGDSAWISLAPGLASGADAGASEGLVVALARALPRNPVAVVSVLDPKQVSVSPNRVCGIPFIEGSISDVSAYRREATAAVTRVDDAALRQRRAECLAALQQP